MGIKYVMVLFPMGIEAKLMIHCNHVRMEDCEATMPAKATTSQSCQLHIFHLSENT